ncbi:uncharacterized protein PSFLO_06175 [Pseudozyma flocculosa]|uniref:Uncharacterized protein n=1 Tax=Pseudozyma flocculosa TaxID=84751 RepID=A0A5C3F8B3_9BASI|nr:uncharacterized protein PSFLO_06175 [Pseudozyma flocculosa]
MACALPCQKLSACLCPGFAKLPCCAARRPCLLVESVAVCGASGANEFAVRCGAVRCGAVRRCPALRCGLDGRSRFVGTCYPPRSTCHRSDQSAVEPALPTRPAGSASPSPSSSSSPPV